MKSDYVVIIPARLDSKRLPRKPLRLLNNKPLIYWTWKNSVQVFDKKNVYVATDSKEISKVCKFYSINTISTSKDCRTGTDRVAEAAKSLKKKLIINLQGDEPFIKKKDLKSFLKFAIQNKNCVTNAYTNIKYQYQYNSLTIPKVVTNCKNELLYMSRAPIPGNKKKNSFPKSKKQVCIYGYPFKILNKFYGIKKNKANLEKVEDIEILRLIENNIQIKMIKLSDNKISIDTFDDLKKAKLLIQKKK